MLVNINPGVGIFVNYELIERVNPEVYKKELDRWTRETIKLGYPVTNAGIQEWKSDWWPMNIDRAIEIGLIKKVG